MSTVGGRIGYGLLVVALFAPTASPPHQERTPSIAGVVRYEDGSEVSRAPVILWPATGIPDGADPEAYLPPRGRSDVDGSFRIEATPGVYHVLVRVPGYRWGHRLGVEVEPGRTLDVGSVILRRGVSAVVSLIYDSGEPAAGVEVGLDFVADRPAFLPDRFSDRRSTTSGPDGTFRLDGLAPEGRVGISFRTRDAETRHEAFSAPGLGDPETPVEFVIERDLDTARFTVEVVSRTGEAIDDAWIYIARIPQQPSFPGGIRVPKTQFMPISGGRYESVPREPGRYRLTVRAPLHRPQRRDDVVLDVGDNPPVRFELEPAPSAEVEVILTDADGSPMPRKRVGLTRIGPLATDPVVAAGTGLDVGYQYDRDDAVTDRSGRYVFEDVPQGMYRLDAFDSARPQATRNIEVIPGAEPFALAFPAPSGPIGTIGVRVIDISGDPISGASVSADRRSQPHLSTAHGRTDADGLFEFEALVDDADYAIAVHRDGYASGGAVHRLDESSIVEEISVTLMPRRPGSSTVTGRIVGLDVGELHRVRLTGLPSYVRADGSFVIHNIGAGEHELRVLTDTPWGLEATFTVAIEHDGDTVDAGDVVLGGFRVAGMVRYKGEPMRGGFLYLIAAGSVRRYTWSEASLIDGRFTLGQVQSGSYRLFVHHDVWGRIHEQMIDVAGDLDLELDLGAATASGTIADAETSALLGGDWMRLSCTECSWSEGARPGGLEVGSDGRWQAGPLQAGTWRLELARPGYVPVETTFEIGGGVDVEVPIVLTATPGLDLAFEAGPGASPTSVRARLLDAVGNEVAREFFSGRTGELSASHWGGAPPGTWTLEAYGNFARLVRRQITIPGPSVALDLPADGQALVRIPALEGNIALAILEVLDRDGRPVAGHTRAGEPVLEWIAPGAGEIYARCLPPGAYTVRVTALGRAWEGELEIEPFVSTTVTLRGPGR